MKQHEEDRLGEVLQKIQDLVDIAETGRAKAHKSGSVESIAFNQGAEIVGTACLCLLKQAMQDIYEKQEAFLKTQRERSGLGVKARLAKLGYEV